MAEASQYQKRKQVTDMVKSLERGQKTMLLDMLLDEWAETLPKRGKDYGVAGGSDKYQKRLDWLQDHWGTQFETKGTTAVRRLPLSGVIELLVLFCLNSADTEGKDLGFGAMEDGSELAEKVASGLEQLKAASGPLVTISLDAYNQLQKIAREYREQGGSSPEASTKILERVLSELEAMPGMKTEKEQAKYEKAKTKKVAKDKTPSAFSK